MRDEKEKTMWDNIEDPEYRKRLVESSARERETQVAPGQLGLALLIIEMIADLQETISERLDWNFLWWRTDGERAPVKFLINCNDLFFWACADCEELTRDNIAQLEQAFKDCHEAGDVAHGSDLFCARVRKMRPQTPCYENMAPKVAALFDAAGPVRDDPDGKGRP